MSRKIIGVTVGTSMKPQAVIEKTEQAKQIERNTEDINSLLQDLEENYALKSEIPTTPSQVGADKEGTAVSTVNTHNTNTDSHNDIRLMLQDLQTVINEFFAEDADNDDKIDRLVEVVALINDNKDLIDSISTNKVNVDDIINNLTTNVANKPLSAAQGVALKALIDAIKVPTKVSELSNDKNYLTSAPVSSVNNKTGAVSLSASDVGAVPTARTVNGKALSSNITLSASDVGALPSASLATILNSSDIEIPTSKAVYDAISQKTQVQIITWEADD